MISERDMSDTCRCHGPSGHPVPPPPKRLPRRRSTVCRTPTKRHLRGGGGERRAATPGGRESRGGHLLLEEPGRRQRDSSHRAATVDNYCGGGEGGHSHHEPGSDEQTRNSQHSRFHLQKGAEFQDPKTLSVRLRRSLSRGHSPRHGRPVHAVIGTELMAPMPLLQGARRTSKNRDRMTVERFIQGQPLEAQDDMLVMLEEYKGRESELCQALSEAYMESWESNMSGVDSFVTSKNSDSRKEVVRTQQSGVTAVRAAENNTFSIWKNNGKRAEQNERNEVANGIHWKEKQLFTHSATLPHEAQQRGGLCGLSRRNTKFETVTFNRNDYLGRSPGVERESRERDLSPELCYRPKDGVASNLRANSVPGGRNASLRFPGMLTPSLPETLITCAEKPRPRLEKKMC